MFPCTVQCQSSPFQDFRGVESLFDNGGVLIHQETLIWAALLEKGSKLLKGIHTTFRSACWEALSHHDQHVFQSLDGLLIGSSPRHVGRQQNTVWNRCQSHDEHMNTGAARFQWWQLEFEHLHLSQQERQRKGLRGEVSQNVLFSAGETGHALFHDSKHRFVVFEAHTFGAAAGTGGTNYKHSHKATVFNCTLCGKHNNNNTYLCWVLPGISWSPAWLQPWWDPAAAWSEIKRRSWRLETSSALARSTSGPWTEEREDDTAGKCDIHVEANWLLGRDLTQVNCLLLYGQRNAVTFFFVYDIGSIFPLPFWCRMWLPAW